MNILELFAHIGLKADTPQAESFLKTVNGIKSQLIGAVAGTLSLAAAIKAVNSSMSDALAMKKFEADTGQSADAMQRWTAVANQVNGAGSTVAETLRSITSNQEKIKLGQGNISGYQLLGIDPRSDPIAVLEQFKQKTQNVSQAMRRNLASQIGISNDLVSTLELSNAQFDKMARNAWVIPQSSIDGMNRARGSLEALGNHLKYIQAELVAKLAPVIEKVTIWIGKFVTVVVQAGTQLDKIIRSTIGWKNAMIAIIGALAIMNAGFLLSPIGLFTMAVLGLILVLQDLYVYSQGGDSLFGDLMKNFPVLGNMLAGFGKDFMAGLKAIIDFATNNKGLIAGLAGVTAAWLLFNAALDASPVILIATALAGIIAAIGWLSTHKKELEDMGVVQGAKKENSKNYGTTSTYATNGLGDSAAYDPVKDPLSYYNPANKPGASTSNKTITIAPQIIIQGSSDPRATGKAAADAVQRVLGQAQMDKLTASLEADANR